jgi:alkaline phosphatase D
MRHLPLDPQRRRLLLAGAGLCGFASLRAAHGFAPTLVAAPRQFPFTLGVASGDPVSDGFVIWTRLAPRPLEDPEGLAGLPDAAVEVEWQVASDAGMKRVVQQGHAIAESRWAHSVHVELEGLQADREYWYAFRCGTHRSPIGHARTAPQVGAAMREMRLAYASCQHFEQGYFSAYRHMVAEDPRLILHLGDYIYESSWGEPVRRHEAPEPRTLAQYRNRHARYKLDPDLQAAHAHCPWLLIWDDHEVQNDYAGAAAEDGTTPEAFLLRRAAAYQAYWEHMPLRLRARPTGADMLLYGAAIYGDLLRVQLLDLRQYRDDQPCPKGDKLGGRMIDAACTERLDPKRSLLGATQERWWSNQLAVGRSRWNLIAQQMLMAPLNQRQPDGSTGWWSDGWDGYPAARERLLRTLVERKVENPVVIGGDIHSFWANDLHADPANPESPVVASEFVGTSISSAGIPYERVAAVLPEHPHVKFFESRERGYVSCVLTPQLWRSDFRVVQEVRNPASGVRTLRSFAVEAGQAGVQNA